MTKRAPGLASAARRLRRVGAADKVTPASRAATSARLRARMASSMADLDERLEQPMAGAGAEDAQRHLRSLTQRSGPSRGEQQGTRIERHRLLLRLTAV